MVRHPALLNCDGAPISYIPLYALCTVSLTLALNCVPPAIALSRYVHGHSSRLSFRFVRSARGASCSIRIASGLRAHSDQLRSLLSFSCAQTDLVFITAKKYTEDHEAVVFDDSTSVGTISITDYAQSSLGDVVFVELPTVGTEVKQGGAWQFVSNEE